MVLLQTAQQEADQVTEATFLTMLVTVKNTHFRRTIPHMHVYTHIGVHTPTSPGNGTRGFLAASVIALLLHHWLLLLQIAGLNVFLFLLVTLQSYFILSDSSTIFPYLRSLWQKDLLVYVFWK